jgi:eukaryotic-like serine/threonine-protein kinase
MTELQSGVFLGHYELLVRVGRGGMASVWVARERSAVSGKQRLVAVKAMLPELALHSEFRSMFLSEVQIIQSIQHDNVVRVFEVSEDQGVLYMAMEWVEGDSLRNIVRASRGRGALPPAIAVCIAADAASGLHAAHELRDWDGQLRGVVHCDVSPHNILVGLEGKAKLVDFGIATAFEQLAQKQDSETIQGKLSYLSPEQALGGRVDCRTDVFALGIVLYEMTMGEQLFRGRDAAHTLELVKRGRIPRPSLLNPGYPKKLEPIVLKALERDPSNRFQSAEEFEYELSNYLTEEHAIVSHPVVAELLWQLLGSRIEKRREIINTIASSIDAHSPLGGTGDKTSWLSDIPFASDPLNFTATGLSEARLGLAARLEADGTENIARSALTPGRQASNVPWRLVIGAAGLLCIATGASYYFFSSHSWNSNVDSEHADGGFATKPTTVSSSTQTSRSDGVLSVESLPVDNQREPASPADAVKRGGGARQKSFDELVAEGAAAAARKGGVAKTDIKPAAGQSDQQPAADDNAHPAGIDQAAAKRALASAANAAKTCRGQGEPPSPQGQAAVTFSPSGSVTVVNISQSFMGTPLGSCIVSHYRNVRVPPFDGEPTTVNSTFEIPE